MISRIFIACYKTVRFCGYCGWNLRLKKLIPWSLIQGHTSRKYLGQHPPKVPQTQSSGSFFYTAVTFYAIGQNEIKGRLEAGLDPKDENP